MGNLIGALGNRSGIFLAGGMVNWSESGGLPGDPEDLVNGMNSEGDNSMALFAKGEEHADGHRPVDNRTLGKGRSALVAREDGKKETFSVEDGGAELFGKRLEVRNEMTTHDFANRLSPIASYADTTSDFKERCCAAISGKGKDHADGNRPEDTWTFGEGGSGLVAREDDKKGLEAMNEMSPHDLSPIASYAHTTSDLKEVVCQGVVALPSYEVSGNIEVDQINIILGETYTEICTTLELRHNLAPVIQYLGDEGPRIEKEMKEIIHKYRTGAWKLRREIPDLGGRHLNEPINYWKCKYNNVEL